VGVGLLAFLQRIDRGRGDVGAHHHAGSAARGRVVDAFMPADTVSADIMDIEAP